MKQYAMRSTLICFNISTAATTRQQMPFSASSPPRFHRQDAIIAIAPLFHLYYITIIIYTVV
jgi:hypothetical protein